MENTSLRPMRAEDVKSFVDSTTRAFFDDPMTVFLMDNVDKRQKALYWMFTKLAQYCRKWGEAYTDENQIGGSLWLTPGNTTMTTGRVIRAGMWQMPFRLGWQGFSRFGRLDGEASKRHKKLAPGDHWYLLMLGVDPDQQGTGIGSAAIEIGAEKAKAAGLPVYLETMAESNVSFYEKRGFEVAEEYLIDDSLRTWSMIRRPV